MYPEAKPKVWQGGPGRGHEYASKGERLNSSKCRQESVATKVLAHLGLEGPVWPIDAPTSNILRMSLQNSGPVYSG